MPASDSSGTARPASSGEPEPPPQAAIVSAADATKKRATSGHVVRRRVTMLTLTIPAYGTPKGVTQITGGRRAVYRLGVSVVRVLVS